MRSRSIHTRRYLSRRLLYKRLKQSGTLWDRVGRSDLDERDVQRLWSLGYKWPNCTPRIRCRPDLSWELVGSLGLVPQWACPAILRTGRALRICNPRKSAYSAAENQRAIVAQQEVHSLLAQNKPKEYLGLLKFEYDYPFWWFRIRGRAKHWGQIPSTAEGSTIYPLWWFRKWAENQEGIVQEENSPLWWFRNGRESRDNIQHRVLQSVTEDCAHRSVMQYYRVSQNIAEYQSITRKCHASELQWENLRLYYGSASEGSSRRSRRFAGWLLLEDYDRHCRSADLNLLEEKYLPNYLQMLY